MMVLIMDSANTAIAMLRHEYESMGGPGGGPPLGGNEGGVNLHPVSPEPSACFSCGRLPARSAYAGRGLVSLCTTSLKRSSRRDWSIGLAVSTVVPAGGLAITSKLSYSSQFGPPTTFSAAIPQAVLIRSTIVANRTS